MHDNNFILTSTLNLQKVLRPMEVEEEEEEEQEVSEQEKEEQQEEKEPQQREKSQCKLRVYGKVNVVNTSQACTINHREY